MSVHQFDGLLKSPLVDLKSGRRSEVEFFWGLQEVMDHRKSWKSEFHVFVKISVFLLEGEFNIIAIKNATWSG